MLALRSRLRQRARARRAPRAQLVPLVRLHLAAPAAAIDGGVEPSLEGLLVGRIDGHYVLERARVLAGEETHELVGRQRVPAARVLFLQELDVVELGGALR